MDDRIKIIGMNSTITEKSKSVYYASPIALNKKINCKGNLLTVVLRGYIFETYAIELLMMGGSAHSLTESWYVETSHVDSISR